VIETQPRSFADSRLMATRWGRWLLAVPLWSLLGLLFALPQLSTPQRHSMLLMSMAQWWSWGLVTPLLFGVDDRLPLRERQLGLRILVQIAPSLLLTTVYLYVNAAMRALMGLTPWSALAGTRLIVSAFTGGILWSWLIYWLIFGARQTFLYYKHYVDSELRLERMERSFSQARLNALRMQLDPHFLFNALNAVSSQVERDPRLARRMIEHLGDLLRLSLESRDRQEVPLVEEMAFLDHYVAIQKIRFGNALHIETCIDPEVKYALVPCFIVQPLVENAIRHGISRRAAGGSVTVTAQRREEQVEIRIADDGIGLPPQWSLETSAGLGLSVTRERITTLHNGASSFSVSRRPTGGTEVEIVLPFRPVDGNERGNG